MIEGEIVLNKTICNIRKVEFDYTVSEGLSQFFDVEYKFFYEYLFDIDLSLVPESILNVPFVMNLIPLIWLTDSTLKINSLDRTFYLCLSRIKEGFKKVYPKFNWGGGNLIVEHLEENVYDVNKGKSTIFFTGGVDATASLINNLNKKPIPFYILGADVKFSEIENIIAAKRDVASASSSFGLFCNFIRSSVRFFYDGVKISDYFENIIKDSWWHGVQHSIGMLSLMAPYAYLNNICTCIIAASFTREAEGHINCVSYPFIDNQLKFGSTNCYHDGYDLTRQDKVNIISRYAKEHNQDVFLRVCFNPKEGKNCNCCEKCIRTIMALTVSLKEKYQTGLKMYGFTVNSETYKYIKKYLSEKFLYHTAHWKAIQKEFRKDKDFWKKDKNVSWILNFKFNSLKIYIKILKNKIKRLLNK